MNVIKISPSNTNACGDLTPEVATGARRKNPVYEHLPNFPVRPAEVLTEISRWLETHSGSDTAPK